MGISTLGQITALLFISHLLIPRKEGEKRSLDGQLSTRSSWMLSPFQMYSIKMKPYYLFCLLDTIISLERQFISLCAVCGSHIWDFNNLHAVL